MGINNTRSTMVQNNNTQQALLNDEAVPQYDTSGSWWAWVTGSKASLECKDRPVVRALKMNSSLSYYEARDTVAAALKGDLAAQRKIQTSLETVDALNNASGRCESRCGPSPEMRAKMRDLIQLLAQGDLKQLEVARTEFRNEMKAKWEERRASGGRCCGSSCGQSSCNKSTGAPLQGSVSKADETTKADDVVLDETNKA